MYCWGKDKTWWRIRWPLIAWPSLYPSTCLGIVPDYLPLLLKSQAPIHEDTSSEHWESALRPLHKGVQYSLYARFVGAVGCWRFFADYSAAWELGTPEYKPHWNLRIILLELFRLIWGCSLFSPDGVESLKVINNSMWALVVGHLCLRELCEGTLQERLSLLGTVKDILSKALEVGVLFPSGPHFWGTCRDTPFPGPSREGKNFFS